MRERYIQQLQEVQDDLVRMGSLVAQALEGATRSLQGWNVHIANPLIASDQAIDSAQLQINEQVLKLIATQQPIATDLRILLSVVAIASELERMGDYTKGIAKHVLRAAETSNLLDVPAGILQMVDHSQAMIHTALDAFVKLDVNLAHTLKSADEAVDDLNEQVRDQLRAAMKAEPASIDCALELLGITHNLERLADRCTNMAEMVVFIVTSEMEELNP
jgi:phosphate transport system protein